MNVPLNSDLISINWFPPTLKQLAGNDEYYDQYQASLDKFKNHFDITLRQGAIDIRRLAEPNVITGIAAADIVLAYEIDSGHRVIFYNLDGWLQVKTAYVRKPYKILPFYLSFDFDDFEDLASVVEKFKGAACCYSPEALESMEHYSR